MSWGWTCNESRPVLDEWLALYDDIQIELNWWHDFSYSFFSRVFSKSNGHHCLRNLSSIPDALSMERLPTKSRRLFRKVLILNLSSIFLKWFDIPLVFRYDHKTWALRFHRNFNTLRASICSLFLYITSQSIRLRNTTMYTRLYKRMSYLWLKYDASLSLAWVARDDRDCRAVFSFPTGNPKLTLPASLKFYTLPW